VFFYGDYYNFRGLTVRGCGSNGIWGYGSHVTVEDCDLKFNGKSAVSFMVNSDGTGNSDDSVLTSHAYFNVLLNWPRGNNGFAESGGGWAGGVAFSTILRPVARGNVVHMNGGEGVISYGTMAGHPSGSALFEQNLIYDNWSVDVYIDNQPDGVIRDNVIYDHPPDANDWLYYDSSVDPWNALGKYSVCVMLADEENSSDATNNYANLDRTQVYNNLLAGCRIGIRDYSEGNAHAVIYHGLKNALIANNTIVTAYAPIANTDTIGIFLQDNTTPSGTNRNVGSVIENNIVYTFNGDPVIWSELAGPLAGITLDHQLYQRADASAFRDGASDLDLAGWRAATGADAASAFADPALVDVTSFRAGGAFDWRDAMLTAGSPARGAGAAQTAYTNDLTGTARSGWDVGAFQAP
jgi:hypothetical protein